VVLMFSAAVSPIKTVVSSRWPFAMALNMSTGSAKLHFGLCVHHRKQSLATRIL
jgi:hypothetical protein